MSLTLAFLLGWLFGSLVMTGLVLAWYVRARRRVASIKASIARYQEAQKVVGEAAAKAYGARS